MTKLTKGPKLPQFSIIEVEFDDPAVYSAWTDGGEASRATSQACRAAGYIIGSTKKDLVLSLLLGDAGRGHDEANGYFAIPHGCIRRVRVIRRARHGTARQ